MNYVVIDLEMCKVPKMYRNKIYKYATEIIEIGTVLLNEDFRQIATLRQYVHPEYGVLDQQFDRYSECSDKKCTIT